MQPTLCSRCHQNVAVVFITKMENGVPKNEGLCLKCAKALKIKPIDDMIEKMGISDEDLDNLTTEMRDALNGVDSDDLMDTEPSDEENDGEDNEGHTATFPFLNRLYGNRDGQEEDQSGQASGSNRTKTRTTEHTKRKFLENYCINLSRKASEGKLDAVIGRERELQRVIQILNRRQKNNPCLIGEPGVGKTAIAEGLALKIQKKDVPYKLLDKEVYLLDLTALVAGTQFRGQFESRMKGLIDEIKKLGNIILVIDEVHSIVGAGDAEGSMNAANILKPALSRGEIQVIGATTLTEYRKYIEKDTALERRFQPVIVEEPSIDESIQILKGISGYYEKFHQVKIPPEMCRLAVTMSERYITDRYLPDKAIDLIDEACSQVNLENKNLARLAEVKKELADYSKERELIMQQEGNDKTFERLAEIRSRELQLENEMQVLNAKPLPTLTAEHLAKVIELWTKIPATQIQEQEFERLAHLEDRLKQHIVGQDEAIHAVASAIRRNRVGIDPKRKPVSFIFVGSTGVGKTELVKQLSLDLFNTPDALIRLDMSEFMEKHSVSRLIGSPPGYVGYDDAGQLTEKIRRKPYSVILFDEIEKAHPDVLNILLQILDDGRVTDSHGKVVNFENTIIVMTSNAGSESKANSIGFNRSDSEANRDHIMNALKSFLRPEFLNRVDEIVCFNQLSEDNFRSIAKIMIKELEGSLLEKGITLSYDDQLFDYLVRKSYSKTYGARNLRRFLERELEDSIATKIIDSYMNPITQIRVVVDGDNLTLVSI